MTDLAAAIAHADGLIADLGQLLERARAATGAARDRAITAAIAVHAELGDAMAEVGTLLAATGVAILERERPGVTLQ